MRSYLKLEQFTIPEAEHFDTSQPGVEPATTERSASVVIVSIRLDHGRQNNVAWISQKINMLKQLSPFGDDNDYDGKL